MATLPHGRSGKVSQSHLLKLFFLILSKLKWPSFSHVYFLTYFEIFAQCLHMSSNNFTSKRYNVRQNCNVAEKSFPLQQVLILMGSLRKLIL